MGTGYLLRLIIGLSLLSIFLTVSCGESQKPAPQSPTSLDADEIVDRCAEEMETVDAFHLELRQIGGTTPIILGLEMIEAIGDVVKPDKMRGEMDALAFNMPIQFEYVTVGNVTLLTNPLTGKWEPSPTEFDVEAIFDPDTGISAMLRSVTNHSRLEDEKAVGFNCYHIGGNIITDDLHSIIALFAPDYLRDVTLNGEIWVDYENFLLRQIRLEGQVTAEEKLGIIRIITFSEYGKDFAIELPS